MMSDDNTNAIRAALLERGVTRLTHFTPARNLPHIIQDRELRSVKDMSADVRAFYTSTDESRFDGHPDLLSCSIQYPNAFYFRQAKAATKALNYPDWACLLLHPAVATLPGALFCPRNASYGRGRLLTAGVEGLAACYASRVDGSGGTYWRRPDHNLACPTDVQAEVLVPTPIGIENIVGIAMETDALVRQERSRLSRLQLNPDVLNWMVSPGLFDADMVTAAVQRGKDFGEQAWMAEGERS